MARQSKHEHVRKICGCVKWKECTHPWYVSYREGWEDGPDGKPRERGLRRKLSTLVGREPKDFAEAKAEARRAIVAWQAGRDARGLIPGDTPTVATLLDGYGKRPNARPIGRFKKGPVMTTKVNGRPLGEWKAADVTRETIETFRAARPTVAGNRDLALLRAMFNWAVLGGLIPSTPFKVGTVNAVKQAREQARTRRLQAGEAERLLLASNDGLHDLIVAAIETGCRRGELLSMQWEQVRGDYLFLPAGKTKSHKPRRVPISSVLAAVLAGRRNDPAGEPMKPSDYVFGDAVGRRRRSIKTAWGAIVLRANGHTPTYVKKGTLAPESRALLRGINLHFHDLRREAASRWMDKGRSLATIQRWLGHANISQTSTYLGASLGNDAEEMRAYEEAAGRLPNVAVSAGSTGIEAARSDTGTSETTQSNTVVH